jgi:hypothetical protein
MASVPGGHGMVKGIAEREPDGEMLLPGYGCELV